MSAREIKANIYSVGVIDWNRRLFDALIPLPDGTSYNSYFVRGSEKTALIDTVDPAKYEEFDDNLKELNIEKIDYIVSHHGEQDHSGSIPKILEMFPQAKVVCTPKCKEELKELLSISDERFISVKDGEIISLGNKNLRFIYTPWVHWPETMVTYIEEDKILFSCDFLGSHYASSKLFVEDECRVYMAAKRYFAEIMMPFRNLIKGNIDKISNLEIDFIAPSHGQVYGDSQFIINAYKEWISDEVKNEVVIPYATMHGSTEKMVHYLVNALVRRGISVKPFNLTETDIGELAMSLVDAATIVIGSPTVLSGPHPLVAYGAFLTNALRPKAKFASIIGSFLWGGKMVETITGMLPNLKVEIIEPVIIKGHPKKDAFIALDRLADDILKKHKEMNLL